MTSIRRDIARLGAAANPWHPILLGCDHSHEGSVEA
jgi:hypothetical protein